MARTTSYGTCALCGYRGVKAGMSRHLKACLPKHDKAENKPAKLFHLRAEGRYEPHYWLDLEVVAEATLYDLVRFLRKVWLECCGHLSMFKIGNTLYNVRYDEGEEFEGEDELETFLEHTFGSLSPGLREMLEVRRARMPKEGDMEVALAEVLTPGLKFAHEYDFGSTTYLKLKVVSEREGYALHEPIRLLARNEASEFVCVKCGKPAKWIHTEERWDREDPFYCGEHKRRHKDEWAFLPVVNSPRMGVCGYTG
ncbi:MAG: hypothetical protein KGZ60_08180 [Truepera sp.]|nr:hypothetical protein [Truepera sp.]MBS3967211.1 hypothetical protein [Truepera sp.]